MADDIDIQEHDFINDPAIMIMNDDTDIEQHDSMDNLTGKNDDVDIEEHDLMGNSTRKNDDTDTEEHDLMDNLTKKNDDIDIEEHDLMDNLSRKNDDIDIKECDLMDNSSRKNDDINIEEHDLMDNPTEKNDDIDIEEHDLMDNPTIKNMFPDLSVLKEEIQHYDEEEPPIKQELETSLPLKDSRGNNSFLPQNSEITLNSNTNSVQKTLSSIKEKQRTKTSSDNSIMGSSPLDIPYCGNKIILGSRPNKKLENETFFRQQEKLIPAKVILDDLGLYLKKSKRYCHDCHILFPKRCDFDVHRETVHYLQDAKETIPYQKYESIRVGTRRTSEVNKNNALNKINKTTTREQNKNNDASNEINPCFHCKKSFPTQQLLIEHLYNILQTKNISCKKCSDEFSSQETLNTHMLEKHTNLIQKEKKGQLKIDTKRNGAQKVQSKDAGCADSQSKSNDDVLFYRCHICSYYFRDLKFFLAHLLNKHEVHSNYEHFEEINKVNYYDPKCRYCSSILCSMVSYNSHLQQSHKQHYTAKQNKLNDSQVLTSNLMESSDRNKLEYGSLVLKSTLFKCIKCDINFLSSKTAMKHSDHMEILINWKCSICLRIFKKNDELLHKSQHLFSEEFIVYELSAVALSRVLYDCPKCAIHFKEENYLSHYPVCGIETPKSVYCKVCDILVDNAIGRSHQFSHLDQSLTSVDFTIIASEIIPNNAFLVNKCTNKDDTQLKRKSYELNQTILVDSTKDATNLRQKKDGNFNIKLKIADPSKEIKRASDEIIENRGQTEGTGKLKLKRKNKSSFEPIPKRKKYNALKAADAPKKDERENHESIDNMGEIKDAGKLKLKRKYIKSSHEHVLKRKKHNTLKAADLSKEIERESDTIIDNKGESKDTGKSELKLKSKKSSHEPVPKRKRDNTKLKAADASEEPEQESDESIDNRGEPDDTWELKLKRKNNKRKKDDLMLHMSYCHTCKCFVTDSYSRKVHLQSRCGHMVKYICKICGLLLTAKAYQTHKNMHVKCKNLTLQDFSFYEFGSNKRIYPPIPEFPKCNICEVHFATKQAALLSHECSEDNYLTCHICEIKLSEEAFRLHILYHNYSMTKENNKKLYNSSSKLMVDEFYKDTLNQPIEKPTTDVSDKESNRNLNRSIEKQTTDVSDKESNKVIIDTKGDISALLFCCRNCNIVVDTYDRMIEHCQENYSREKKQVNTYRCLACDLIFDSRCYENHKKIHSTQSSKDYFKVLKFDTFYLLSENDVWIKHVFGAVPQDLVHKIISKSIYKVECRIKMKVTQEGLPELTVYRCDMCRCFIGNTTLFRHAENSCFKLRKYPCSFCGLPFNSSLSRMQHQEIHKDNASIGIKSYRIVTINRDEDQILNNSLYCRRYVLYQCRNCDGIVETCQVSIHGCDRYDLKKCLHCGLLIYKREYDLHDMRHKELVNFSQDNMKVILFGDKTESGSSGTDNFEGQVSSFSGVVCDYTFYICIRCKICVKTMEFALKHTCSFGASRSKCQYCDLYIPTGKLKFHSKLHENDPDLVRENIKLVPFDSSDFNDKTKFEDPKLKMNVICKAKKISDTVLHDHTLDSKKKLESDCESVEECARIYKCTCGLHFLDEASISNHLKLCCSKIRASKQKCSKCDLLFTPNILFTHLLMHHGNKNHIYKFDIVEINPNKEKKIIYKCSKCKLYFVKEKDIDEHFNSCESTDNYGIVCIDCNLTFDPSSLFLHEDSKNEGCCKDYKIIDFNESSSKALKDQMVQETELVQAKDIKNDMCNENTAMADLSDNDNNVIYKCIKCGIHYLTKKSIRLHLSEEHGLFTKLQDICNICGLNFIPSSLDRHINIHHEKLNLKPDDLIIIECGEEI